MEQRKVSTEQKAEVNIDFNKTELGFKGSIFIDKKDIGHFSIWKIDDKTAYLHDIQIGYDENAPRNKGYGLEAYKQIIDELRKQDIKLISTDWATSQTTISPQSLKIWEKLLKEGYANEVGKTMGKIYDRFTGEEIVGEISKYESI